MPSTTREARESPAEHNIQVRISNFRIYTATSLLRLTALFLIVGPLWLCMKLVPSVGAMPHFASGQVSLPVRWTCIMFEYFEIMVNIAPLLRIINYLSMPIMTKSKKDHPSRVRSSGSRTTDLEDWILGNICVVVGLAILQFSARCCFQIFKSISGYILHWSCVMLCAMIGFGLLVWLFQQGFRLYRNLRNISHERINSGMLIGLTIIRLLEDYAWLTSEDVLRSLHEGLSEVICFPFDMLKSALDALGYVLGRGPLFDRLTDEQKAGRRACRSWDEVYSIFAFAAGRTYGEETDDRTDTESRNDQGEIFVSPFACELGLNPVIFAHRLDCPGITRDFEPPLAGKSLTTEETGMPGVSVKPDMSTDLQPSVDIQDDPMTFNRRTNLGPTTMSVDLDLHACEQCEFKARRRDKLNKHIKSKHKLGYACNHFGCEKRFPSATNCERHKAIHNRDGPVFTCPNTWCETPQKTFTRKDNLDRHRKRCINPC